jgi:hypothetical protein
MGALLGETGGGGTLKVMKERLWEWASLCMGAQLGNLECSSTGDFKRLLKGALELKSLSLWELCEGNLEGGLPCWGP